MAKTIKNATIYILILALMLTTFSVVLPPAARAETLGAFEVTNPQDLYEYKYENGVLTILKGDSYYNLSIKNTDPDTPTTDRIEVADGAGVVGIALEGVNIDVSALDDTAAIKVNGSSQLDIIVAGNKNTLISGKNCAGIQSNGGITINANNKDGLIVKGGEGGAGIGGGRGCDGANINVTVRGVYNVTGGAGAAGIGGGAGGSGSNITVSNDKYWTGSCFIAATGGEYGAGIGGGNGGSGSGITINGSAVVAAGGAGAAGIGGGKGGAGSDITITGGTVTAAGAQDGGSAGAGIGGGADGEGADIMISGGSVRATAGAGANDIGGGSGRDAVTPTDGLGMVYLAEISNPNSEDVTIDSNAFTPVNHTAADSADTTLYAYLRGGIKHNVTVGSAASTVDLTDKPFSAMDFTISATDAGNAPAEGTDYTYGADSTGAIVLNILTGTPITVANTYPSKPTTNRIAVAAGVSADVTLAGVNIDVSATNDMAAFGIADDSAGDVTVTLKDGTENTLLSGTDCAGLQKNGESGTLTIDGAGKLTATGGSSGASIGGGLTGAGANITVRGGTIIAAGGQHGAGIGGGASGKASNITVSGGTVTATSIYGAGIGGGSYATASGVTISGGTVIAASSNGAGIGNGSYSYSAGSNITISGGTVTATSANGAGIGGGNGNECSNITITGGSVRALSDNANAIGGGADKPAVIPTNGAASVYLLTIKNLNDEAVMIDGSEFTPVNHRAADSADGNLYVYLTASIHTVKVGDTEKEYDMTDGVYTGSGKNFKVSATNAGETLKYDIDYTYPAEEGVLTVLTDKAITIKNADPDTATTDRIEVAENVSANITLAGVNISSTDNAAFRIADSTAADVVITLADGSKNRLQSPDRYAGLQKGNNAGALTINGTGELSATGGFDGAGIGGGYKCVTSKITISGGTVIAAGSGGAAGIGGGYDAWALNITISGGTVIAAGGDSGNIGGAGIGGGGNRRSGNEITISGGTVTATGGNGAGIGGGDGGHNSSVVISGGSVKASSKYGSAIGAGVGGPASIPTDGTDDVLLVTIENPDDEPVEIDGKPYTPVNHRAADSADGNLYAYLKAGEIHNVKVGGAEKEYDLTGDDYKRGTAFVVSATNEGETLEYGVDYTFPADSTVLTVLTDKAITIKNADPDNALRSNRIIVADGVNANITLAGVNIDISNSPAFRIGNGSGKVTVTLAENTVNILKSGTYYAGLHKVSADSTLTINGTGELRAFGGDKGAGIGNGYSDSYGSAAHITINGGTITAAGGSMAAGIGGGNEKSGEDITINGGAVIATGGTSAAGIGGGSGGRGENITINGGTVTARGGGNPSDIEVTQGAGIGGGVGGRGANITINGGSVRANAGGKKADDIGDGDPAKGGCTPTNGTENVYLLVIANPDDKTVLIDGKEYLPINHKAADSADGSLYAYLTGVNHEVTVGETALTYAFSADKGEFVQIGLTAPEAVTGLVYNGTERQLVTAGSATAGTLVYALEKDGAYSGELPTGIDAGVYTVWYRVEYGDYAGKAESVEVEIAKAQVAEIAFTIGAPAAGEALDTAAQAVGAEYALSPAKWKPADVTARYDAVYTVTVTAKLADARNYRFADSVTAAVNGAAANTEENGGSVTITYTFPRTAKAGLTGITVTPPAKLEYIVGESIDVTGGRLVLSYQDGTTEEVALSADMLTYDNTKAGKTTVNISFSGFTDTFEINFIQIQISQITITGIEAPVAGGKLTAAAQTPDADYTLSAVSWTPADTTAGYDTAYTASVTVTPADADKYCFADDVTATVNGSAATVSAGENGTLTISYRFPATAKAELTGIKVVAPDRTEYTVGDRIDVTGGRLTLTYKDNTTSVIDLTADMLAYDNTKTGKTTVTVTYDKFKDSFEVTFSEAAGENVAAPVISPNGGTFYGSQKVTIACRTKGAVIRYTLDGSAPTAESTLYTGAFNITSTATVRAIAVKDGKFSSVTTTAFTKKTSSGGGNSGNAHSEPDYPEINGKTKSWRDIADELTRMASGSEVKIGLLGNYNVPAEVIKAIADKKIKAEFAADSTRSWIVDGSKITAVSAADLSALIGAADKSTLRGVVGADLIITGTGVPAEMKLSFRKEFAGQFANVYKLVDKKPVFLDCVKIDADGTVIISGADAAGEYIVTACEFSDLNGDMNNDGTLNALDAAAILKDIVSMEKGANPMTGDFNGDGAVNALDAAAILMKIVGKAS